MNANLIECIKKQVVLVGFTGRAKSGKSTAVDIMREMCYNKAEHGINFKVMVTNFAEPIKQIGELFGFTHEQMNDQAIKEVVTPLWDMSPRKFMQLVGSEMFRNYICPDVWIKHMFKIRIPKFVRDFYGERETSCVLATHPMGVVLVGDVRFQNEAEAIQKAGGKVVMIKRDDAGSISNGVANHVSEKEFDLIKPDLVIENNGTLEDLKINIESKYNDLVGYRFE